MITKYDIGDEVLVRAKVIAMSSKTKDQISYMLRIENDLGNVCFDENEIVGKVDATANEVQELRDMVNELKKYCNINMCDDDCVLKDMECFESTSSQHTGHKLSDEQLLENKELIIKKYEAVMAVKEDRNE